MTKIKRGCLIRHIYLPFYGAVIIIRCYSITKFIHFPETKRDRTWIHQIWDVYKYMNICAFIRLFNEKRSFYVVVMSVRPSVRPWNYTNMTHVKLFNRWISFYPVFIIWMHRDIPNRMPLFGYMHALLIHTWEWKSHHAIKVHRHQHSMQFMV